MQLPPIDRVPSANRVIPVAPVNPAAGVQPPGEPASSMVNLVNPALKSTAGESVYTSVSDPAQPGSEAATSQKDWTVHRPIADQVEAPAPKPVTQVLLDQIKTIWSASPVQLEQVKNHLTPPQPVAPSEVPGNYAREILTYAPNKIKKNEAL